MKIKYKRANLQVPMNATCDVAFLLLIFIMVVSLINYKREVKIDYPEAAQLAQEVKADKNLSIWINKEGELFLDGEPSDIYNIEKHLADVYRNAPDTRIHIAADKNTAFKNVNNVVEILQLLEYRVVSFVVHDDAK
ncbi:MAG: biopolymer transporter ExbD [Termitinemataceae bacterium]|nr:MAG: biopolymer transporter ExbD [Termitinemataceae bacterium]